MLTIEVVDELTLPTDVKNIYHICKWDTTICNFRLAVEGLSSILILPADQAEGIYASIYSLQDNENLLTYNWEVFTTC